MSLKDITKKPQSKPKFTDAERHKRFVETAKKVEASDNIDDFDRAFAGLEIKLNDRQSSHDTRRHK
jgi:hypothetical protein